MIKLTKPIDILKLDTLLGNNGLVATVDSEGNYEFVGAAKDNAIFLTDIQNAIDNYEDETVIITES